MVIERLKKLRAIHKLSQRELAVKLGVATSTVAMYESGKRMPDGKMLSKIADLFNVSVDYLLGRIDEFQSKEIGLNVLGEENKSEAELKNINDEKRKKRRERDINKILDNLKSDLSCPEGLMFNGEPATDEAIESILSAIKVGLEIAKDRNQKYTPNKYR